MTNLSSQLFDLAPDLRVKSLAGKRVINTVFTSSQTVPKLKLTILTQFYPPDFAATGQFVEELATNLSQEGMEVTVFTGMPGYAYDADQEAPRQEDRAGVKVYRSRVSRWGSRNFFGRLFGGLLFCLRAALHLCSAKHRGDLLLFVSEPPYLQTLGYLIQSLFRIPYACLVYDLYPDVAVELGVLSEQHWIVRIWNWINRSVWNRSSVIIVPSDTMQERIVQRAPHLASKLVVIHNWADANWIKPLEKKDNEFAKQYGLTETFTVLYSGNMGRCHDMDTILNAAIKLQREPIQFLFIGAGPKRLESVQRVEALGLKNCRFLPYQDKELLPQSLTACDLALVSVARGMEGLVAPSKFYSALASGRPIAVICEPHSYLRQMIADARCGAAFSNGDGDGLAAFIRHLSGNRSMQERLGEAGRHYVSQYFTPEGISQQYKRVLQQAILKNSDLKQAIEQQEFSLYYQAIFTLGTGRIQGFEALLRWHKYVDQVLLPRDFIPQLEATGWICELTSWVLLESAKQLKQWQISDPLPPAYIRVNLSPLQFFDPLLVQHIENNWLSQGLEGNSLGFDITETTLIQDPAGAIAILIQLREMGIQIYLDSFGSGVASLQSLHQFPLDGLALDRTLIGTLGTKYGDQILIESLLSLSENLRLPLHAEGIATLEQLTILKSLGFQLGQGQWLAPPVNAAIATQLLGENRQMLLTSINPIQTQLSSESPERSAAHVPSASNPAILSGPLVLVVDDEAIMRKVMRRFLEQDGYRVIEAPDAEMAITLYQSAKPSIVLLDGVLPGMSGFDCCRQLRQLPIETIEQLGTDSSDRHHARAAQPHIYLVTARDDEASVNLAFDAGANDYLTKPVNWAILRQRLQKATSIK